MRLFIWYLHEYHASVRAKGSDSGVGKHKCRVRGLGNPVTDSRFQAQDGRRYRAGNSAGKVVHLSEGGKVKKLDTRPPLGSKRPDQAVPRKAFSMNEMRKYIDPSSRKEAEEFVQLIYDERRRDGEGTAAE